MTQKKNGSRTKVQPTNPVRVKGRPYYITEIIVNSDIVGYHLEAFNGIDYLEISRDMLKESTGLDTYFIKHYKAIT